MAQDLPSLKDAHFAGTGQVAKLQGNTVQFKMLFKQAALKDFPIKESRGRKTAPENFLAIISTTAGFVYRAGAETPLHF